MYWLMGLIGFTGLIGLIEFMGLQGSGFRVFWALGSGVSRSHGFRFGRPCTDDRNNIVPRGGM